MLYYTIDCSCFSVSVHQRDVDKLYPAKVQHDGQVTWEFPVIFMSSCPLDVTYFPYDQQHCDLYFVSWTYDISKLDIYNGTNSEVDKDYTADGEWKLMGIPVERSVYADSSASHAVITYTIKLQRKPLYYVFNLIIPCFFLAFCGILVFLLPPKFWGESVHVSDNASLINGFPYGRG